MSLNEYRRKRDPKVTPEPFGGRKRGKQPIFVVQRHDARRLHYDFRLERDGVLLSWAVPKGVPLEPGERALAVHVEDHPLEYAKFHGEIPAGQYGAGSVEIWDHGTYELVEEKKNGQLKVRLHGERLQGMWTLVPAHMDGKEQNWLIIRSHDGEEEQVPGTESARHQYSPMLATLETALPRGSDWSFEVKFDGFRALAYVRGGECELVSRNGNRLNDRFPEVAKAIVKAVKTPNAVIDGEITRVDAEGRSRFSELQRGSGALVFFAFDLLEADGERLVDLPLTERKERLRKLLDARVKSVAFSESFDDGEALFHVAQEQHLEGVIAKKKDSAYKQRRTRDWLKLKTENNDEFLVAGYTRGAGRRANTFGALVLAVNEDGKLRYVGNVGTGFDDREIARLLKLFKPLQRKTPPFDVEPKMPKVRKGDVQWLDPKIVVQVRYGEWTHDGRLRHPAYLGLRDDKAPDEVVAPAPRDPRLKLTNLDKPFWPDEGITKGDLLDYYEQVAHVLVPHLKDRPFTMRRYPDGAYGKAFFQKKAPAHMPDWIPRWNDWAIVNEPAAVLWMVNMGCIDMNAWYSRIDKPERPDFVLFDLDPTPEVPWTQTVEVALILKELLDQLGLESFPKTSGGKGMHILVPIERRATYEDTRHFSELVAGAIARVHPKLATTEWSKARRRGVLIDANQNGEGKTIASAYSVRPHPGAPVSAPLRWDEVNEKLNPSIYSMDVVLERVRAQGDVYAGVLTTRQSLAKALARIG